MTIDEQPDEVALDASVDDALRELVLQARSGDLQAAYEVLGRQVPVDTWVAVLHQLARQPTEVDLELVAHRALRRPPAVVSAVLDLVAAAQSPIAAFLARVVFETREEERIKSEAARLNAELVPHFDLEALLLDDDGKGAVYALMARPLVEEARFIEGLGADSASRAALVDAARAEYERLQEVARDTRWRSGSYRHALRHALADLALVAGAGGRLEDQAFRLLQQRTEHPESNAELLALVSPDLRVRYLEWALDRSSAEASPARALFALSQLEQYPNAVDRSTLRRLLASEQQEVAVAAAIVLIASDPTDGSSDHEIAELLTKAGEADQVQIIATIVEAAAERLRPDLWPESIDQIVTKEGQGRTSVVERLAALYEEARGSLGPRVLRLLVGVGATVDGTSLAASIARSVMAGNRVPDEDELDLLASSWLRGGAWKALEDASPPGNRRLLDRLAASEEPANVWRRLDELYERLPERKQPELEKFVLDAVAEARLAVDDRMAESASSLYAALEAKADERACTVGDDLERLRALVALGDEAAQAELAVLIDPLVERAVERSSGNSRLQADYAELREALRDARQKNDPSQPLDWSVIETTAAELGATGIEVIAGDRVTVNLKGASAQKIVRALALLDQRIGRASTSEERSMFGAVLRAVAEQAAVAGVAQDLLKALFERGSLFQAAVALSPETRFELLSAARTAGFDVPAEWRSHEVLGAWLREALADPAAGATPGGESALIRLARLERERRETEQRMEAGRVAARHAFVVAAAAALEDLEQTADAYVQLWLGLARLGIHQVAALGQLIAADQLDPMRHELIGERDTAVSPARYVVRSAGLEVGDEVVRRARLEAVS